MADNYLPRRIYDNFRWSAAALACVFAIGTAGYMWLGHGQYSLMDCFYMTFVTVSTIGYSEIIDLSHNPAGRLFTVFIGFTGIGVATYILSNITAFVVEGDLNEAFRRRKMDKQISRLAQHYIVCGVGQIGHNVINELRATQHGFVIVDVDQARIDEVIARHGEQLYVVGDATDDEVLRRAGIRLAKGVFAVSNEDSKNLVISMTAKQLNPAVRVVARCHAPKNVEKTRKAGADAIVSPDHIGGLRMASEMIRPNVVSFLDMMLRDEERLRIEEAIVPQVKNGVKLSALNLASRDFLLIAVRRGGGWQFNPHPEFELEAGNTLIFMATPRGREEVVRLFAA